MRFHLKTLSFKTITGLLCAFAVFGLSACMEVAVKKVGYADAIHVPETARPHPLKFSGIKTLLPPGTEVGLEGGASRFCSWPRYPVDRGIINKSIDRKYIKQGFHDTMEANGYDVVDSIDIAFRAEDEIERAEYFISAKVKDIDLDTCRRTRAQFLVSGQPPGTKGKFYTSIDWSVYDALRRRVVYKTTTEGYSHRKIPNLEGLTLLFQDSFEMATHNLAADEDFYNLIVKGTAPPDEHWKSAKSIRRSLDDQPSRYDPRERVNITPQPLSDQPVPKIIDQVRSSNVLIQKSGHGSGVFITKDGHILTNQHVVGDAKRMRIVTKAKKHKLIAEVLRVDKVRDVALLKLESIPDTLKIEPLPIRSEKLTISEDVYTIGNPFNYRTLQETVTKGIVSAHRFYKVQGIKLPFIQADVDIHGGNSGGALMDKHGNIVGLSVSGIATDDSQFGTGLNFFIPISQALNALDITIGEADTTPYPVTREDDTPLNSDEAYEIIIEQE